MAEFGRPGCGSAPGAGGGRTPIHIDIRTDGALALAISLEETAVGVGLVNLKGGLALSEVLAVARGIAPGEATRLAGQLARRLVARVDRRRIIGAGVAAPGLVDPATGINEYMAYHDWHEVPLAEMLAEEVGLPVRVENRSRAVALGEHWYGAGRAAENLIAILVSEVIGAGIVIGERIHHGRAGRAAEVGHTVVVEHGPPCTCGKRGCLEAISSIRAIATASRDTLGEHLADMVAVPDSDIADRVLALAAAGQPAARAIVDNALHHLALAVANLTVVLDPELVILGGGLMSAGDLVLPEIVRAIDAVSLAPPERRPRVALSTLGADASLVGAATLVFERLLDRGNPLAVGGYDAASAMTALR